MYNLTIKFSHINMIKYQTTNINYSVTDFDIKHAFFHCDFYTNLKIA